ncbi:MAG: hypothetical protein ACOCV7_03315 [Desulfonatronovibrionaceae bacterium]
MRVKNGKSLEKTVYLAADNPRIRRFRMKYRPGQVVPGIVLEYDGPHLAWVLVEDLRLLAWVLRDYFRGQRLYLLIENTHPDIILRELDLSDQENWRLNLIV